jgi:hypothetical protein
MIDSKMIWNIGPNFLNYFAQNYFADSLQVSSPENLMIFKGLVRLWRTCAPLAHSGEMLKNQKRNLAR